MLAADEDTKAEAMIALEINVSSTPFMVPSAAIAAQLHHLVVHPRPAWPKPSNLHFPLHSPKTLTRVQNPGAPTARPCLSHPSATRSPHHPSFQLQPSSSQIFAPILSVAISRPAQSARHQDQEMMIRLHLPQLNY